MITRSTRSLTDRSVPPLPDPSATTALPPVPPTAPAYGPDAGPPSEAGPAYPDPVDGLLHAAAANRPLEDVARLITLLERCEGGEDAAAGVLRVVGTDRPLEDVPLLVTVLSRPPHHAEHAGHMIRAAAESRSVEEVTRLMALLYREPLEPRCGEEAVRTAATHRPVEEVVELVERLARERAGLAAPPSVPQGEGPPAPSPADGEPRPARPLRAQAQAPQAPPDRSAAVVPWSAWATAVALALCAAAYIPVHHDDAPVAVLAAALASAGICLLLALLLVRGPTPALLMVAVLVPAALAGAQLLAPRVEMTESAGITEATLAPAWLAAPTAAAAALTALLALLLSLLGGRRRSVAPSTPDRRPLSGG
ncbi:hypothetical protein [Streptomyces sp. SLBN-115]|uniref:hypothetical protein n=1 Tax=Streptomyces sp. SLBN-115 TaxID=2768453 RepID=UPI00115386AB|nr:hypothetical protein [Streptomyces sp. SLBN-115]TQJ57508.1 hypothetical protein FBY34_5361 [Streptomyces sp. SLBN-115]